MDVKKKRNARLKTATISIGSNELMMELEKKFFENDNNYIDYFMEIGVKPEIFKFNYLYKSASPEDISDNLIPQIISKFPNFDKRNVIVEKTIANQIFPHGFKVIESKKPPEPNFYCLVLDNQLYSAIYTCKYLSCLIIYESISSYKELYDKYKSNDTKFMAILGNAIQNKNTNDNLDNLYIPKCLCIVSIYPYVNKYEEILRAIYDIILSDKYSSLFIDHIIEKLIIETPRVPNGLKKIKLQFPNRLIDISENKMNEYPSVNINLSKLFEKLNINTIIEVYKYLILETKMIFFSDNISDLTNAILSFLSLLAPFKYQFQIVSVLPKELYNYIETISPYLFGINESYSSTFFTDNKISIEETMICIVDLDKDKINIIGKKELILNFPDIPKRIRKKIEEKNVRYMQDIFKNKKNPKINRQKNISMDFNFAKTASAGAIQVNEKVPVKKEYGHKSMYDLEEANNSEVKKEKNKKYQLIFYKIMINMLKEYPKFLSKDYSVNKDISMSIKDMIDLNGFLNTFSSNEKNFCNKLFNTQMFIEFIYKRMMPKDCNEKVEVLFFEEKVNEKVAKKNLFNKNKILTQNILLPCKDYDYEDEEYIVDLTEEDALTSSLINYIFEKKDLMLGEFLNRGYIVELDENSKNISFNYCLFPCLLSEKLFILNVEEYQNPPVFYKEIEYINNKIVSKSYLKFIQQKKNLKNSEMEDNLFLCYVIIWALTFWYTDDIEKDYRFLKMLSILEKIEEHDIKTFEALFRALVDFSSDENVIIVYKKFIHLRLNPSWEMFSLVSKIIKKKQNANNKNKLLRLDTDLNELNEKFLQDKKFENKSEFRERTIKFANESIISNNIIYHAYLKCDKCDNYLNIAYLCANLPLYKTAKDEIGIERIKCKNKLNGKICEGFYDEKIIMRFGEELFNQKLLGSTLYNKLKTSKTREISLFAPTELKVLLLDLYSQLGRKEKFDVEYFRFNYAEIFWSLIFYFELNDIDKTFMLPYNQYVSKGIKLHNKEIENCVTQTNNNEQNLIIKQKNCNIFTEENKKSCKMFKNRIKKIYHEENLFIQNAFNFLIINKLGMLTNKNILIIEENIGYNEIPLPYTEKDSNSTSSGSLINMKDYFDDGISIEYENVEYNKTKTGGLKVSGRASCITGDNTRISKAPKTFYNGKDSKKRTTFGVNVVPNIFDFEESESSDESA